MSKAMLLVLVSATLLTELGRSTAAAQGKTSLAEPTSAASWQRGFGLPGADSVVYAFEVFDDGSGPSVYVGGDFHIAGSVAADGVARWTGARWEAVGPSLHPEDQKVRARAVY